MYIIMNVQKLIKFDPFVSIDECTTWFGGGKDKTNVKYRWTALVNRFLFWRKCEKKQMAVPTHWVSFNRP